MANEGRLGGLVLFVVFVGCGRNVPPESIPRANQSVDVNSEAFSSSGSGKASASNISPHDVSFIEAASDLGFDFTYRNGQDKNQFAILESLGGGVAVLDYDLDGWPDIFCTGGGSFEGTDVVGHPSALFRNHSGKKMVPVSGPAGQGFPSSRYSHGAFSADFNQDGFPDVLVTGYGGLQLWKNQGDGSFIEVHEQVGLQDNLWSSAAGWGDFNSDGLLDLYVSHYVDWSFEKHPFCRGRTATERDICPPREFSGLPDKLYICSPDGRYEDKSAEWGLKADGKGLGVLVADFDGNGHVDVYVANDTVNNFLYSNKGTAPFSEIATVAGVAADKAGIPNGSMGVDALDYNQTGRPSIWVTNYEREDFALYRNEGPGAFLHVSDIAGVNVLGGLFVGFGTVCNDFNLDGREDIVVNNGHVILYPTASPRKQQPLFLQSEGRRFVRKISRSDSYFSQGHEGRGLATVDFDMDGDLDLVFSNINEKTEILRNQLGASKSWIKVKLIGRGSNRDAIGAIATLTVKGMPQTRIRKGGCSYMSTNEDVFTWGLGDAAEADQLVVLWPSGKRTVLSELAKNQHLLLVEPQDE
jgi:hypothetical protein